MASATQAAAISGALFAAAPLHTKPRSVTFRITASKSSNPPIVGRKLRAAVIGAGPSGSSAAEALAAGGAECFLFERAPSEAKPCGGAIPICMLDEFDIPARLIDRHVTRMRIFSPSNLAVDFGKTLRPVRDAKYITTFRFLDLLQKVFYGSDAAREALVELCGDEYVQRMTFESYLYMMYYPKICRTIKTVAGGDQPGKWGNLICRSRRQRWKLRL